MGSNFFLKGVMGSKLKALIIYCFSEFLDSLNETGSCLLEKNVVDADAESGN